MAKIRDASPKTSSGGYQRVFANEELGNLITKVHTTNISNGTELEKIIQQLIKDDGRVVDDCKEFFANPIDEGMVYLIPKKIIKKWDKIQFDKAEPDFIIVANMDKLKKCYIIELKDGNNFDTKKSSAEKETLTKFRNTIAQHIEYTTSIHVCCFNAQTNKEVSNAFKGKFTLDEVMTGEEFCTLLGVNYQNIVDNRASDALDNIDYFVNELLKIDAVKERIN